jgi:hypothetical protein
MDWMSRKKQIEDHLWLALAPKMDESLTELETRICDFLVANLEPKLKDYFLADLSWAVEGDKSLDDLHEKFGYASNRKQAIINFFTKRMGKRVFELLPDDIKNYILANSL